MAYTYSKISIYTASILAFELPVILTHSLIEVCVLDSLIVWKPQSLSSEILLHPGSLFGTSNDH